MDEWEEVNKDDIDEQELAQLKEQQMSAYQEEDAEKDNDSEDSDDFVMLPAMKKRREYKRYQLQLIKNGVANFLRPKLT